MLSVHWRLAELWTIERSRELTEDELSERSACLHYNAIYARKLAGLHNMLHAASIANDEEWASELRTQIEKLEAQGQYSF